MNQLLVYGFDSPNKGDLPSGACSGNHVKVIAWLWGTVGIDRFHDMFQDVEGREATDASAVEAEEVEFLFCSCHDECLIS